MGYEKKLPERFELTRTVPSFEKGEEILGYCKTCRKNKYCDTKSSLQQAMGDNFPYWSENFVSVNIPAPYDPEAEMKETRTLCMGYKSPQLKIPGMPEGFPDGVKRLEEKLEREKEYYKE